jgi:uncharacterized protein YdeI (YjbR/CyaY-like superfamily)
VVQKKETDTFCPASRHEWRQWLKKNHRSAASVWLLLYKKQTGQPTISWSEAVEEALCFGWIDSIRKPVNQESFIQFFGKRKPASTWSKINKEKVQQLIDNGQMMKAGLESIETAKQNGCWTILDEVEEITIPKDLSAAFRLHPGSAIYFSGLSRSVKKAILQWLVLAKRPVTRQNRIDEIASMAAQKKKPKQF